MATAKPLSIANLNFETEHFFSTKRCEMLDVGNADVGTSDSDPVTRTSDHDRTQPRLANLGRGRQRTALVAQPVSGRVMGLPASTAGLKRHISITMESASRTISPVPDISRYVSECLVSSVSPRIFPGGNGGGASPVRSPQPVWKLLTPLPVHLHPKSLRLSTSATSQEAATPLDPHVTTRVNHPSESVHRETEVDEIAATSAPAPGVLARGSVRPSVGVGRRNARLAARYRLARASRPLGSVPDALAGPLLQRDDRNGRVMGLPAGARPD